MMDIRRHAYTDELCVLCRYLQEYAVELDHLFVR